MIVWFALSGLAISHFVSTTTPVPSASACPTTQAVVRKAVRAHFPPSANSIKGRITTLVTIVVSPDGVVRTAVVRKSSGYPDADAEAVKAAKLSEYTPKMEDCHPVYGWYIFRADFEPDPTPASSATA